MENFPDTRPSLLLRVKASDNARAWEEFAALYRPIILRMAQVRGMQEADAQDLAQHVLFSVHSAIDRWEPQSPETRFRNWLSKITRNAILKALRPVSLAVAEGGSNMQSRLHAHESPEPQLEQLLEDEYRRELYLRAAEAVQREVNARSWQAFQWTVLENNSIQDVATKLNQTVGSIYAMRSRVMRRLRDVVRELQELEE